MRMIFLIDQFRSIKIQPNTVYLSTRLRGISPTISVVMVQRSIVVGLISTDRNWSIAEHVQQRDYREWYGHVAHNGTFFGIQPNQTKILHFNKSNRMIFR